MAAPPPPPLAAADAPMRFAHFELMPAERVLRVRGEAVTVGSRAFDLLLVLAQRHDRLVTKQELLDLVWPGLVVEEHNVATQISTLRKLLGPAAITTLPGYGYRLTALPAAPPGAAVDPARHNLPAARTRFIGREAALADLGRRLSTATLLTLTGVGGCGKTRLALQLAQQHKAAFAGGAWFVDLAPLQDGGRVAAACGAVFGLREEGDRPLAERLRARLIAQPTLLVLDNCEHLLDATAALVEALRTDGATGSASVILATSREGLGVAGEQVYPVRPLALPAGSDLAAVRGAEAAGVFVDRAQLACPDFELDADNAAAVAEICRRLDGIPLALELAAARVTMLPPAEIARRLDDRFRLLTGGQRALPRHQTLQAAMHWSYELLRPDEQRLLRQLAVFADGWTLASAAELAQGADEYEVLAHLTALHDKSLLVVDREVADGTPRYRMLETVRQYALQALDACGETEAARARHVAHFIALAEEAGARVRGPEQDRWMRRFRQEQENLVAALSWCGEGMLPPQDGLRLAAATGFYWCWNQVELGERLTRAVLARDDGKATAARRDALLVLARMAEFRGRHEEALQLAEQALALARRLGSAAGVAWALNALGSALGCLGRLEPALQAKQEALALAAPLNDGVLRFTLLNNLATQQHRAGRLDEAERSYREALRWAREHVGRVGNVVVLDNLIRLLVARGALEEARAFALECLPLARGERVSVDLLEATVGLAARRGEPARAARFWGAADRQLLDWGYRHEPGEMEHLAPLLAASRQALGEAAFAAAEAEGRGLPFEAVLAELEQWLRGAA